MDASEVEGFPAAFKLFFVSLAVILIGMVLIFASAFTGGVEVGGGGVVLIGPIPIIFGAGPLSGTITSLAIILTIIALVLFFLLGRRRAVP